MTRFCSASTLVDRKKTFIARFDLSTNPTGRFSNRAEAYALSRPDYPVSVLGLLQERAGMKPGSTIADLGSGTGILTELLLKAGNRVYGVEPNAAMRKIAEEKLVGHQGFISVEGRGEASGLEDNSVDLITVAQAFHWFDLAECRREFKRILKQNGSVVLLWNFRKEDEPFVRDYEGMLFEFSLDYSAVRESYPTREKLRPFYGSDDFYFTKIPNPQVCDLERLRQLLISSSYLPAPGHPRHEPMMGRLEEVFERHAQNGAVTLMYETCVYMGVIR